MDEKIKLLMRQGIDDAFKLQVAHLYKTWLSNPADLEDAQLRASVGAKNAIDTYRIAMEAIDKWEG